MRKDGKGPRLQQSGRHPITNQLTNVDQLTKPSYPPSAATKPRCRAHIYRESLLPHKKSFAAQQGRPLVKELVIRVVAGGLVVSVFALLGDILKPKTFAGLFGAAPSVALVTLILTTMKDGKEYASLEARSMILGAIAFFLYAGIVSPLLLRLRWRVLPTTGLSMILWFAFAFGLCYATLGWRG